MQSATDLDRLRAWLEGRLQGDALADLERDLQRDPALAELGERLRDVFALTAAEADPPPCRLTFADLERHLAVSQAVPWGRRAAAAALILGAAGAATWALRPEPGRTPAPQPEPRAQVNEPVRGVQLQSLTLAQATPADLERAWVPEVMAGFDPLGERGIAWLEDQRAGTFIARAARRPMLVLGSVIDCPDCARLKAEVFSDPAVLGVVDRFVPLHWNLSALPEKEAMYIREMRGYPLLEVWSPADEIVLNFSGMPGATKFEELLHQGLERADATGEVPEWDDLRDWARRWLSAERARSAGRVAEAQQGWRDLARRAAGNLLAEEAVASLRQLEGEARSALLAARELAASDTSAAAALLAAACERFAGTEWEGDLRSVLDALRARGSFPELLEPTDS